MSRSRTLRELMIQAAEQSGVEYRIVFQSGAPKFKSEGALRTKRREWRPPEWHERFHRARELAREERRDARDRHRASTPYMTANIDIRPGRRSGDEQ